MMKSTTKTLIAAGLLSASVMAEAGLSANVGAMSDYYFRGLDQTNNGASMMGGLDYEHESGLYAGTWIASVTDGVEYDIYGGYAGAVGDFGYSVGYTGYFYSDDDWVDGNYQEVNLSVSYGPVTLAHNIGEYDDGTVANNDVDYTFTSLTGEYEGAYLTYGAYGDEVDGDYFEVGYGTTYEGIDLGVAAIFPDMDTTAANSWISDNDTITFSISKSFDF
jgi:uncharacterized protein (TIGR02001 family)